MDRHAPVRRPVQPGGVPAADALPAGTWNRARWRPRRGGGRGRGDGHDRPVPRRNLRAERRGGEPGRARAAAGQEDFARSVLALGRPVVVLLWSGRPLVATPIFTAADAVLAAWLPCHGSGEAIAALLSGAAEPAGRLPMSWPASVGQIPVFFGHRPTGRPYADGAPFTTRYLDAPLDPLYPFGHGLGYTTIDGRGRVPSCRPLPARGTRSR